MNFIIRPARSEEALRLTEIAFLSKAYWGYYKELLELWRPELEVSEAMIESCISFVVEEDSQIVGFWCRPKIETLSDGRLFILPQAIGKGYGRALWQAVMAEAKKLNIKYLTWEGDPNALGFYLKMGAKQIGSVESSFVKGRMLPVLRYHL